MNQQTSIEAIKPGVFAGISNASYHGGPGISKSGLDIIRRSPLHYQHSLTARREPTPDQRIGTLAHALILEPETIWDHYSTPFVAPEGALATVEEIKERLKGLGLPISGKKAELSARLLDADPSVVLLDDARALHAETVGDRAIVTAEEMAQAEAIRDAVMSHPAAGKLLAPGSGVAELSAYWRDKKTGALCRCRPDWWRHDGIVIDLKTARDASPEGFSKSIQGWRYHVQAAFYLDGIAHARAAGGVDMPAPRAFVFIGVEKTAPYAVGVYTLDAQSLEIGRREYREDLATYAECRGADVWPGYGDKIQSISLPEWRLRQDELNTDQEVYAA